MPSARSLAAACATLLLTGCLTVTTADALDPRWDDGPGSGWSWGPPDRDRDGRGHGFGRDEGGLRMVVDRYGRPVRDRFGRPIYVDRFGRQVATNGFGRPQVAGPLFGAPTMPGVPGFPGRPGGGQGHGYGSDPRDGLSPGQSAALDQGCIARYEGNPAKLRRCLNGDPRLFENALEDGCHIRYSGNAKKLGRCLRQAQGGGVW